jgi:antitoxin component YwqK of YwqJK toxin-antitoxin module
MNTRRLLTALLLVLALTSPYSVLAEVKKVHYDSGNLKAEWNYENGMLQGISKSYHENGSLKSEANFKDGKQEGITKLYDEDGNLEAEVNYKNGKLEAEANCTTKVGCWSQR